MTELTLALANRIIEGAFARAAEVKGKPVAVCVLNRDGHIISLQRQDGATMFRNDIALGKAWGAVAMGEPSRSLAKKAQENPAFVQALSIASGGRLLPNPGGVLIRSADGKIIGAVGISGDSGANDEALAAHGVKVAGLTAETGQG